MNGVVSLDNGGHVFQRGQNLVSKLIMGVDLQTWRIRIGTFVHPRKCRNALKCLFGSGEGCIFDCQGMFGTAILLSVP